MIELFKKSRFGQITITAFLAASVTAGVAAWLYESIRIPTLNGQLAFREDKIKDLEAQVQKEKDRNKALAADVENEKLQSAKWRRSSELTREELGQISAKLREAQDQQYRLTQELATWKLDRATSDPASATNTVATQANRSLTMDFEEAVVSCGDQEDMALLILDNHLTDLRLVSYANFIQEYEGLRSKVPTDTARLNALVSHPDELTALFASIVAKPIEFLNFRLALERLRTHLTKKILESYRGKLAKFAKPTSATFAAQIRPKPEILTELTDLTKALKSNESPIGWNSNATTTVETFITSNKFPTGAKPPETPRQTP